MEEPGLILELPAGKRHLLAPWRATPGAALLSHGDRLFVRGLPAGALPGFPCLRVEGASWIPVGNRLPVPAPAGEWQSLSSAVVPEVPRGLLSGEKPAGLPITLRRAHAEREATLLATPWEQLAAWATTAAQARLDPLRFAVGRKEGAQPCAFVSGSPLPPLPGTLFCRDGALAVPAGWSLDLPAAQVTRLLGVSAGALAVLRPADAEAQAAQAVSYELLAADCFLPLSRAGARATAAALAGGAPSVRGEER